MGHSRRDKNCLNIEQPWKNSRVSSFLWNEDVAHLNHQPLLKQSLGNLKHYGLNQSRNFMSHYGHLVIDS